MGMREDPAGDKKIMKCWSQKILEKNLGNRKQARGEHKGWSGHGIASWKDHGLVIRRNNLTKAKRLEQCDQAGLQQALAEDRDPLCRKSDIRWEAGCNWCLVLTLSTACLILARLVKHSQTL